MPAKKRKSRAKSKPRSPPKNSNDDGFETQHSLLKRIEQDVTANLEFDEPISSVGKEQFAQIMLCLSEDDRQCILEDAPAGSTEDHQKAEIINLLDLAGSVLLDIERPQERPLEGLCPVRQCQLPKTKEQVSPSIKSSN